ncbi:hypothetical protein AVEN_52982-1 [Araneus ventricosus]|uniref:Uncharacterized protein n=1 Tax=Araneus ventricosus TaxID=182803 RepID=A0A4Y2VBD0_ARAVE|nr:hypothetical protein AVEN_52982-1 [Araneus ventricosus]
MDYVQNLIQIYSLGVFVVSLFVVSSSSFSFVYLLPMLSYRFIDKTPPHAPLRHPNRLNGHGTVPKDRPSDKIPKNVFSGGLKRGELSKPLGRMFDDKYIVTNMESRFPAVRVLWLGREFYKVKHGVTSATVMAS